MKNNNLKNNQNVKNWMNSVKKLPNGVRVCVQKNINPSIIFNKLGSLADLDIGINGMAHLFEHYVFRHDFFKTRKCNASTNPGFMIFFSTNELQEFERLIDLFYKKTGDDYEERFNKDLEINTKDIEKITRELENEYYYRLAKNYGYEYLGLLFDNPLYIGGRADEFKDMEKIKKTFIKLWESIDPNDISILIPEDSWMILVEKTFGTKKKTYTFPKIHRPMKNIVVNKSKFIYLSYPGSFYTISFKFDLSEAEMVNRMATLLNFFVNTNSRGTVLPIGDYLFLKYCFPNNDILKKFVNCVMGVKPEDLHKELRPEIFANFEGPLHYNDYAELVIYSDYVKQIANCDPLSLINEITEFWVVLKDKMTNGDIIITTPHNNFLKTNIDKYNVGYCLNICDLDNLLVDSRLEPAFSNILFSHNPVKRIRLINCKYNINKSIKMNNIPENYMLVNSHNIYDILCNKVDIINVNRGSYVVDVGKKYRIKSLENDIINYSGYGYNYNPDFDFFGDMLGLYLFDYKLPKITDVVFSLPASIFPKNEYKINIDFSKDRIININTPYKFIANYFKLPNNTDFDVDLLAFHLKSLGYTYASLSREYYHNKKYYYYLFSASTYPDDYIYYVMNYIKSFEPSSKIITVKSDVGKYCFNEFDEFIHGYK
jgi:hypothetical protein